jgi:hypothetical protein
LEGLGSAVPGVAFTADGLAPFVGSARVQYAAGEVAALAGDVAAARAHWQAAARAGEGPRALPWADAAARRLGRDEAGGRARLEKAAAEAGRLVEQGTRSGQVLYASGLVLRALGREDLARERFRAALLAPDQQLSHYLAGRALRQAEPF